MKRYRSRPGLDVEVANFEAVAYVKVELYRGPGVTLCKPPIRINVTSSYVINKLIINIFCI